MYRLNIALRILTLVICTFAFTSIAQGGVAIAGGRDTGGVATGGGGSTSFTAAAAAPPGNGGGILVESLATVVIALLTNGMPLTGF